MSPSNEEIARSILDANSYLVLGSVDGGGSPWVSPVWFAHDGYRELFWVSNPEARHSRNIAVRPELAMVVFDSSVRPGEGQAVYMRGSAAQLTDAGEVARGLEVFSLRSVAQGAERWEIARVRGDSHLRLFRAQVSEFSILDPSVPRDVRVAVQL